MWYILPLSLALCVSVCGCMYLCVWVCASMHGCNILCLVTLSIIILIETSTGTMMPPPVQTPPTKGKFLD